MGLSATGYAGVGNDPREQQARPVQHAQDLLAKLIDRLVDDSQALSQQLLERYGDIPSVVTAFAAGKFPSPDMVPRCVAEYFGLIADTVCCPDYVEPTDTAYITSPDALSIMLKRDMLDLEIEVFRVIFLNGSNAILSDQVMWTGTVNSVQAHPREVMKQAILVGATAIVLAHNHPSSSAYPSATDLSITRKIVVACAAIDVEVHDHMIIARDGAFSMRSAGLLTRMKDGGLFR